MLRWKVKCLFFILTFMSLCYGKQLNRKGKKIAVQEIIQKIYNLTSQSLRNGNPEEKKEILKSIKMKLHKSAEALGPKGDKYIKLIMRGIEIMANKDKSSALSYKKADNGLGSLRNRKTSKPVETTTNSEIVKRIASKIFQVAQKQFRRAKTIAEKQKIMENIKQKVLESAKQKHDLLHTQHSEIKTYTDLISRGMELMMDRLTNKKRRMIMEFVHIPSNQEEENMQLGQRTNVLENAMHVDNGNIETINEKPTEAPAPNYMLTTPFSCDEMFRQTCSDIQSLNVFTCFDNGVTVPLNKICDGIMDCSDGSDERDCFKEAAKKLHHATDIMTRIDVYLIRNCFQTDDNSLLMKQNGVLFQVLQKQIGFLNKYKDIKMETSEFGDVFALKQTINEVAIVIKTLSIALDSSLCIRRINQMKVDSMARKYIPASVEDLDELLLPPEIPLRSCKCRDSFCANSTCPEVCKRVCWHRHILGKWSCSAVDGTEQVSLDMVCDGKLDCYDETDETGCNEGVGPTKFEANDLFQKMLDTLHKKILSEDYNVVKGKLLTLQNSIKELQKETFKPKINVIDIKNARDLCYSSLSAIYEAFIDKVPRGADLEDMHYLLLTLNEQLITALKRSHTGNDKIISPDGCYCRNGKCALRQCSKGCTRACSVEPNLKTYSCKSLAQNSDKMSVTIDKVCNGKPDCPSEEDEAECSKEVCRKHHLMLLRRKIRDVGDNQRGTLVGEALRSWKAKVISTLKIAENNFRSTSNALRDIINEILHDLVMSYASLEETKRNHHYDVKDFSKVSQLVLEAVKSCGH